jgi:hypothetical protein
VGLGTAQRTATSTEQCPWCTTTTRGALYLILTSPWTFANTAPPARHCQGLVGLPAQVVPPFRYPHSSSDPSLPPSGPVNGQYRRYACRIPLDLRPPTTSPPTSRPSPSLSPVPPSAHAMSPSQTKSVGGSIRRSSYSPITERTSLWSAVPLPQLSVTRPRMDRLVSTSIETFSTTSCVALNPTSVPQS